MGSIGVKYEPAPANAPNATIDWLRARDIAFVRVQWVDLTNLVRFRVLPLAYFAKLLQTDRPGVAITKAALGLAGLSIIAGFGANGEYWYQIDLATLKICPYAPRHASVMGWFREKTGTPRTDVAICPRSILARAIDRARDAARAQFLVGFETEFVLLNPAEPEGPVTNHTWSASSSLYTGSVESRVLEEIADALQASGIEVQMYHAEGAPKQYEVITGPLPPLEAADALIHTRETIYNIANKHGLRATLSPRPYSDSAGSGAHVHISIHSTVPNAEEEVLIDGIRLRTGEASFVAGLIHDLPSLTFLTYPLSHSYERMKDGIWSGGTYACWGVEHREAPVRVCHPDSPATRNFEVKTVDGTSNPYLVLAGIIGAGSQGIVSGRLLSQKPLNGAPSASQLTSAERESQGIVQRLPLNLEEARESFRRNPTMAEMLGEVFVSAYLEVSSAWNQHLASQRITSMY